MKQPIRTAVLVCVLASIAAVPLFAAGTQEDSVTGTWFGGSSNEENAGYKYQYTFIRNGQNSYYATADGAYNPDSLGAAVATTWTGELLSGEDGSYTIRLIALTTNDPEEPPEELPVILAVEGSLEMNGTGEMTIRYHYFAAHEWGTVPFVDEPVQWMLPPGSDPIVERIRRMPTASQLPQQTVSTP
jgi:hypothetical protein